MTRIALSLAAAFLASGCGVRAPLEPAPGEALPVAPQLAPRALTADELLAQPTIARPSRVDELVTRSEEREDDRFERPPQ